MIDIDHFKSVNDAHGHVTGDACLQEIAKRIENQMRTPMDMAARFGGEEFCIVLPETDKAGAKCVAERIRQSIDGDVILAADAELNVSVSIGVYVHFPDSKSVISDFIEKADTALYLAKRNGRNRVELQ